MSSPSQATPPKASKRDMVIKEMLMTEKTYVEKLTTIVDVFLIPLREKKIIDEEQLQLQFGCVEIIKEKHESLLERFEVLDFNEVGALFKSFIDDLVVYEDYLVNFDIALTKRAALLMSNRKFANYVETVRNENACKGQPLESYLIAPVQRIPRYRLLLEQVLKYTDTSHPDYQNIVDALEGVSQVAMAHNEAIRRRETKDKLMDIMMRFDFRCRVNLLEGERTIIREGVLGKQCRRGIKDFTFWVFSDEILYGEQQIPGVGYYTSSRVISFSQFRVSPAKNINNFEKAFLMESPAKSFIVWAKSPEECADWSKLILDTVNAHKSDQEENTGYIAPVWTPDSDCTQCELCAVQFTVIQRRHHCRNCGAVVCDSCSKKRFLVAHINQNKESRVCDPCYVDLTETRTDNAEESNREHQACPGDESSKSNLPRRGRQSVILRGIDVEEMSNSPVKKSEKDKHRLSYKQRESTGEDGGVFVENPIRAYFSSLVNRKKPPPPSSPPPASALANIPPPPPSAPPPPPPDPKTLPRKPEIPNDAPKIQIMNNM